MTYAYTTGPRRRLVLGAPHAPARLCVPISREVYDTLAALPEREQGQIVRALGEFLGHVVEAWQELIPTSETAPEPMPEVVTAWPAPAPDPASALAEASEEPPCLA